MTLIDTQPQLLGQLACTSVNSGSSSSDSSNSTTMSFMESINFVHNRSSQAQIQLVINGHRAPLCQTVLHQMQEGLFFSKKSWNYCDGVSKYMGAVSCKEN